MRQLVKIQVEINADWQQIYSGTATLSTISEPDEK